MTMRDDAARGRPKPKPKIVPFRGDVPPPHSMPAEGAVLANCMLSRKALEQCVRVLKPEHFFSEAHRQIFAAVIAIATEEQRGATPDGGAMAKSADSPADVVTVGARLRGEPGRLAQVGGMGYLTEVLNAAPAVANVVSYCEIVFDTWHARQVIATCQKVAAEGFIGQGSAAGYVERSTAELASVMKRPVSRDMLARFFVVTDEWLTRTPPPREYLARDARTGSGALGATGVCLLAAKGGGGKSYATLDAVISVVSGTPMFGTLTTEKGKVLIVTAEDERDELRRRLYDVAKARGLSSVPSDSVHVLDFHDASATLLDKDAAPTEFSGRLLDFIVQHGPYALVVLDPVARLAGASIDKDNGNASALIAMFEAVSTAAGGLVVGIHHTSLNARKTGLIDAAALRGATVLGDNSRMVLFLGVTELEFDDPDVAERLGELVTLSCVKANYVRKWKPIDLRRGEHGELLPLDDFDKDLVAAARRRAEPEAAREAARAARRETLERAQVERVSKDAAAVRAYVLAHPGCSVREARLHATGDKADRWGAAIAHLGAELLQTRTGQGTRVGLTIVEAP